MATINGNGQANTIIGTQDGDVIRARGGNDTVLGGEGNDSIIANAGDDYVEGGLGDDTLKGGNGNDWLFGGEGDDVVIGNKGNDTLVASTGNDTLNGGNDFDTVVFSGNRADYSINQINATTVIITDAAGNAARVVNVESFEFGDVTQSFAEVIQPIDDLFVGTSADEVFVGGIGDDTLSGLIQTDAFDGGEGFDFIDFSAETNGIEVGLETLSNDPNAPIVLAVRAIDSFGNVDFSALAGSFTGVEQIEGTAFDDRIGTIYSDVAYVDGGDGNDIIVSGDGNETLVGGNGNDSLAGFFGDDLIVTGDGFDLVAVEHTTSFGVRSGNGHDVVTDFDVTMDLLLFQYSFSADPDFDPLSTGTQTADGALLNYADDSSVLLEGVDLADLNESNVLEYDPYVLVGF